MEASRRAGLAVRVWTMLVRPGRAWPAIAAEADDTRWLMLGYVAPLSAVQAICGFVGPLLFTFGIGNVRVRPDDVSLALQLGTEFLLGLLGVVALALWIALLAPAFGGVRDRGKALKLVGFSGTAYWVSGVFALYPSLDLSARILAGVYSLYTLYLGLPATTGVEGNPRLTFLGAILLGLLALAVVGGMTASWVAQLGGPLAVV